ncbi:MAG: 30S ribosomal protein S21 [Mesorhizobium sp.]|uniref:30S ribosomal protein S21 n=1 Tax=Mesorhizobium sp. TaxID=1871066 RepID=UPI001229C350|nr:30S ribosomal protein S21 [Mesorhizobium sp.]TIQ29988.1 MAG: 30S ribosomal protein S21 [Mesorhizobium sp.]
MASLVRDNNIDQALRVRKKKMQREGSFREMRARKAYEKPSERRGRKNEAIRPAKKLVRKRGAARRSSSRAKKKPIAPRTAPRPA